jgi:ABC-2 type transport system permease protein
MNTTYLKYETLRLFRNRQNFIFSLIFPFILYLFVAGQNRHQTVGALSFPTYYMAGMIAFGAVGAVLAGGARIALEREGGWVRQLRISPLSPRNYFRTKILGSYLMAAFTIALLYVAGAVMGVRMPAGRWLEMTGLILVGLIPFAALGIMLGHLVKGDTMGPVMGFGMSVVSILGGAFFPLGSDGSVIVAITKFIPSFWIVRAGHTAVGGAAWGLEGWLIVIAWSVLLAFGAGWAYRRDTGRA